MADIDRATDIVDDAPLRRRLPADEHQCLDCAHTAAQHGLAKEQRASGELGDYRCTAEGCECAEFRVPPGWAAAIEREAVA